MFMFIFMLMFMLIFLFSRLLTEWEVFGVLLIQLQGQSGNDRAAWVQVLGHSDLTKNGSTQGELSRAINPGAVRHS